MIFRVVGDEFFAGFFGDGCRHDTAAAAPSSARRWA